MIDTHTEELAALYVLDTLHGAEREAFEERLQSDEEVALLVRQLSDGLHAPLRAQLGPERMDLLENIHRKIGVGSTPPGDESIPEPGRFPIWFKWSYAWAAAASILLVLNLLQLDRPRPVEDRSEPDLAAILEAQAGLEEENRIIRSFNQTWEKEYMNLAQRMLPFFSSRDGIGRFTVIDLVDVRDTMQYPGEHDFDDLAEFFLSSRPASGDIQSGPGAAFAALQVADDPELTANKEATVGFIVWRDTEERGSLDVYNLPQASAGKDLFLWVRSADHPDYKAVGFIPELDEGSGSFYFSVDEPGFIPQQVLITEESVFGPDATPSRDQVMVGP